MRSEGIMVTSSLSVQSSVHFCSGGLWRLWLRPQSPPAIAACPARSQRTKPGLIGLEKPLRTSITASKPPQNSNITGQAAEVEVWSPSKGSKVKCQPVIKDTCQDESHWLQINRAMGSMMEVSEGTIQSLLSPSGNRKLSNSPVWLLC